MFPLNALPRFRFISRNQQILRHIHRGSVYFLCSSRTACTSVLNNSHHLLQRTSFTSRINKVNIDHFIKKDACQITCSILPSLQGKWPPLWGLLWGFFSFFNALINYNARIVLNWNNVAQYQTSVSMLFNQRSKKSYCRVVWFIWLPTHDWVVLHFSSGWARWAFHTCAVHQSWSETESSFSLDLVWIKQMKRLLKATCSVDFIW